MDELIGKGLGVWMIIQLLFYMSTTMVPLALPLGILLASIMTFGNMGENFELVAIKSAGISLLRFMRPLLLFIILIGGLAFLFNNNVIPYANLKALSLLYDLRNSKPTFNIRAGQFNKDIDGYFIRVGEKDEDGKTIRNIMIYDHVNTTGNENLVLAKEGQMIPTDDKHYLIFRLKDGWRYQEKTSYSGNTPSYQQYRMHFRKWDKVFDLSAFRINRTNENLFKDAYQMMSVVQLTKRIDSFRRYEKKLSQNLGTYISVNITMLANDSIVKDLFTKVSSAKTARTYEKTFLDIVPDSLRSGVIQNTANNVRSCKGIIDISANDRHIHHENYLQFNVEWHRKFTLSFACVLLFLIGAPLGAIIRKGGIGMPLVIAVLFFVVFHITSITGEKLAKKDTVPTWLGMWMSTGMLLPMAFVLIQQARNDSQIFTKEWYIRVASKLQRYSEKNHLNEK